MTTSYTQEQLDTADFQLRLMLEEGAIPETAILRALEMWLADRVAGSHATADRKTWNDARVYVYKARRRLSQ